MSRRVHDQTIFRRYPYPLAQAWARARSLAVNDAERVSYACGALELFLRYFGAICVQDYLRGPPDPAVERRLTDLSRVSCGQWLRLCREASRAILARKAPAPFLPELVHDLNESGALMARLDRLVEERNRSFAHATQPPPAELARAAQVLLDGLAEVLDNVAYLADWRPFRIVTEARTRSGAIRGKVRFYTGQLLESEPRHATWDGPLVREAIYLAASDGRSALELTPLISVHDDTATRREALFLWEGTDREAVKLITRSLDTGREEFASVLDDGLPKAFSAWLARRGTRENIVALGENAQGFGVSLPAGIPATMLASVSERFEFIEPLGDGGMASVWRVRDRVTSEESALKILKPGWADDPQSRDRFLREARTLIDAAHPHVVPVNELIEWGELGLAIRMPVMTGGSVRDRAEGRPQPPAVVREWLHQSLEALAFLHARGIVHRDVKPQNLLFDADGRLRLADFGIALSPGDVRLTRTRESLGTVGYMAPEQLRGGRVGPAADIHALGVAAHEWLTGALPEGAAGTGIEHQLGPLLAEMTALEPSARPDAATLLVRLGYAAPAIAPPPKTPPARRRPPLRIASIVLSVLAVGVLAAFAWQLDRRSQVHPLMRLVNHAQCGNGAREPGEGCDDGNRIDSDGCSNECLPNAVFLTGAGSNPSRNHWILGSEKPCQSKTACAYEQPATPILMSPFWLARTETTLETFAAWAERAGIPLDEARRTKAQANPSLPVGDVPFEAARALCRAMGGRLPNEAEWEYAARDGGRDVEYPWGDAPPDCDRAVLGDHHCSLGRAWPVCSKPLGNTSLGVCDLAGNVWEWVVPAFPGEPNEDHVRPYPGLAIADPPGADYLVPQYLPDLPGPKPIRGGGHWHTVAFWNRARARYAMPEGAHEPNIGFRCAWDSDAFPLPTEFDPLTR